MPSPLRGVAAARPARRRGRRRPPKRPGCASSPRASPTAGYTAEGTLVPTRASGRADSPTRATAAVGRGRPRRPRRRPRSACTATRRARCHRRCGAAPRWRPPGSRSAPSADGRPVMARLVGRTARTPCSPSTTRSPRSSRVGGGAWRHGSRVDDVVPAARTVLVRYRGVRCTTAVRALLLAPPPAPAVGAGRRSCTIDVELRRRRPRRRSPSRSGCPSTEVVRSAHGADVHGAFCGFAPASPTSSASTLRCSCRAGRRRGTPCPPARSPIAAEFTAVYPTASPGGWHLLGRTSTVMFDVDRDAAGVGRARARPCDSSADRPMIEVALRRRGDHGPGSRPPRPAPTSASAAAGPPTSPSHDLANRLVGNDPAAATLETLWRAAAARAAARGRGRRRRRRRVRRWTTARRSATGCRRRCPPGPRCRCGRHRTACAVPRRPRRDRRRAGARLAQPRHPRRARPALVGDGDVLRSAPTRARPVTAELHRRAPWPDDDRVVPGPAAGLVHATPRGTLLTSSSVPS